MARSRQSAFDDLMQIASKLPWKVSLGLAAISLLALHLLAAAFAAAPTATTVADMGGVVIHQGIHVVAFLLQFVVPPAFLIGAVVSYIKRGSLGPAIRKHSRCQQSRRGLAHMAGI
jgi:restriction system protein